MTSSSLLINRSDPLELLKKVTWWLHDAAKSGLLDRQTFWPDAIFKLIVNIDLPAVVIKTKEDHQDAGTSAHEYSNLVTSDLATIKDSSGKGTLNDPWAYAVQDMRCHTLRSRAGTQLSVHFYLRSGDVTRINTLLEHPKFAEYLQVIVDVYDRLPDGEARKGVRLDYRSKLKGLGDRVSQQLNSDVPEEGTVQAKALLTNDMYPELSRILVPIVGRAQAIAPARSVVTLLIGEPRWNERGQPMGFFYFFTPDQIRRMCDGRFMSVRQAVDLMSYEWKMGESLIAGMETTRLPHFTLDSNNDPRMRYQCDEYGNKVRELEAYMYRALGGKGNNWKCVVEAPLWLGLNTSGIEGALILACFTESELPLEFLDCLHSTTVSFRLPVEIALALQDKAVRSRSHAVIASMAGQFETVRQLAMRYPNQVELEDEEFVSIKTAVSGLSKRLSAEMTDRIPSRGTIQIVGCAQEEWDRLSCDWTKQFLQNPARYKFVANDKADSPVKFNNKSKGINQEFAVFVYLTLQSMIGRLSDDRGITAAVNERLTGIGVSERYHLNGIAQAKQKLSDKFPGLIECRSGLTGFAVETLSFTEK